MCRSSWTAGLFLGAALLGMVPAQAADPAAIDKAIHKGVERIKATAQDGAWGDLGPTALNALTLLECGEPEDDPIIVKAAEHIRKRCIGETRTYVVSLCILFLDRLHDPGDVPLIESLAVRLLAGQDTSGGWSYTCPAPPPEEVQRLELALKERSTALSTQRDAKPPAPRTLKDLPEPIRTQLARLNANRQKPKKKSDNSNTQFATFAVWAAHRHGIPIDDALDLLERRIRSGQLADGGWGYYCDRMPPGTPFGDTPKAVGEAGSTATMTCAGLCGLIAPLGLLAEKGPPKRLREAKSDPALQVGLLNLATAINEPITKNTKTLANVEGRSYYFLWSLERVCVGLNLSKLHGLDWYGWGAKYLLLNQQSDGSWKGEFGFNNVDTCFALLFLKRANLIRDLTTKLGNNFKHFEERKLEAGVGFLGKKVQTGEPGSLEALPKRPSGEKPPSDLPGKIVTPTEESEAAKLAEEFKRAPEEEHLTMLANLRDGKGPLYTEALTAAIDRLVGPRKEQVRKALVERLERMKPDTLRRYLGDEEAEIRRAAALASANRNLTEHIPDLIARLRDPSPAVVRAAHEALISLSGEELPKDPLAWQTWWKSQRKE
jgi:hypothetical protein